MITHLAKWIVEIFAIDALGVDTVNTIFVEAVQLLASVNTAV